MNPPVDGGGFAECHSPNAQTMAVPFRAASVDSSRGYDRGVHRIDNRTFLWVWAHEASTLREDKVTRINAVEVFREPQSGSPLIVCTRIDIAAPVQVDREERALDVAVLFTATAGLPEGPVRVIVNWVAGCPCETLPSGNATATFT